MHAYAETQSNSRTSSFLIVFGAIAVAVYSYATYDGDSTGLDSLFLLGAVQMAPLLISFVRGRFSYLSFVLFSHFFIFTFSRLNLLFNLDQALTWDVLFATEVLAKCTLVMLSGSFIVRNLFFSRHFAEVQYEPIRLSPNRHLLLLTGLLSLPFVANDLPPSIVIPVFSGSTVIQILIFTCEVPLRPKQVTWGRVLLFISGLQYFAETGFMTFLALNASVFFIYVCMRRKTSQLVGLMAMTIVLSAIQSVKGTYREYLGANRWTTTASERVAFIGDLLVAKYSGTDEVSEELDSAREKELAKGFARLGDNSLETVLVQTPALVPFWNGETYATIPFMFIPRFLWPDKPARTFWNKYGHLYGILSEDDMDTSVGVGYLAEAYMNYGFLGLYLISFGMGILLTIVERASVFALGGPTYLAHIVLLLPMLSYSMDLGSMLNSVFLATCALLGLKFFLTNNNARDAYGTAAEL